MSCKECRTMCTGRCDACGQVRLGDGTKFNENDTVEEQNRSKMESRRARYGGDEY